MRRAGEVISAEGLVREVWGPQYKEEIGFMRRYVWRLQGGKKTKNPRYIHNERGFGYRFGVDLKGAERFRGCNFQFPRINLTLRRFANSARIPDFL